MLSWAITFPLTQETRTTAYGPPLGACSIHSPAYDPSPAGGGCGVADWAVSAAATCAIACRAAPAAG